MNSLQDVIIYNLIKKGIDISEYPLYLKELCNQYRICNICKQFGLITTICHVIEHLPPLDHTYTMNCPQCDGAPSSMQCNTWQGYRWGDRTYKCYSCNDKKSFPEYCFHCQAHYCPSCYATHHIKLL